MKQERMTLRQFQRLFQTEKACIDRLFKLRWPNGYRCPRCGHTHYSFHSSRRLYQCSRCKYQVSVTAGTIFHKTRTSLVHWFWIIFIMTRQKSGVSMLSLQGMLGIKSYRTVWAISHKIRKAMADRDAQRQLTGLVETLQNFFTTAGHASGTDGMETRPSIIVEVENRGGCTGFATMRHATGACPPPSDQTSSGKPNSGGAARSAARLPDSETGFSDEYDRLNPLLISDRKPTRTRSARILLANLKGNIRGVHHGVSGKHLHRYLAEFLYRFNRRAQSSQILNRVLEACLSVPTITYAELTC